MQLPLIEDYQRLFLEDVPLIDVRAPIEFVQGAFPQASNLPLLNDEERHVIGIRYAELGQEQAIELGHELVSGETKDKRVFDWVEFTQQHPEGAMYCFRGGMRSKLSQQWIYDATGIAYPRIAGGYKALRRFLINELNSAVDALQFIVIGGRTGVGKTHLLHQVDQHVDLEGIYHHRGSSFGYHAMPQPSQIDIENKLAITLLKQRNNHAEKLLLEDEAPNIGSRSIPMNFMQAMQKAPLVLIEAEVEDRVQSVFDEYITNALLEFQQVHSRTLGFELWAANLRGALERIQRRLGDQRYRKLKVIMNEGIELQSENQGHEIHKEWIRTLLLEYYDPMYDYQIEKKSERIIFRGGREEVLDYLNRQPTLR